MNPYGLPHWILSPARLPVPPLSQLIDFSANSGILSSPVFSRSVRGFVREPQDSMSSAVGPVFDRHGPCNAASAACCAAVVQDGRLSPSGLPHPRNPAPRHKGFSGSLKTSALRFAVILSNQASIPFESTYCSTCKRLQRVRCPACGSGDYRSARRQTLL